MSTNRIQFIAGVLLAALVAGLGVFMILEHMNKDKKDEIVTVTCFGADKPLVQIEVKDDFGDRFETLDGQYFRVLNMPCVVIRGPRPTVKPAVQPTPQPPATSSTPQSQPHSQE